MGQDPKSQAIDQAKEVNWGWLQACFYPGGWWFRLWGWGLRGLDHRRYPALFSERIGKQRVLHLGPWCVALIGGEPKPCAFEYPAIGSFPWRSQ